MIDAIKDFLGDVSGYRSLYLQTKADLDKASGKIAQLTIGLEEAKEKIRQLELLTPHPPPPTISVIYQRDTLWIQQRIDDMRLGIIRYPLDTTYYLTNKPNFFNIVIWDWCDTLKYIKEKFDCENFSILFKAYVDLYFQLNQVAIILDYKSAHSYDLVFYPDGNMSVLEPENDCMYVWTKRPTQFYHLEGSICIV